MSSLVHYDYKPGSELAPSPAPLGDTDSQLANAMAFAKVGAWSCNLADNRLSWTPGVYDLFGLPIGRPVDRRETIAMYSEECRETMERLRAQAIARCGTIALDAKIIRPDGSLRWMRLTGEMVRSASGGPRLHGLKQDVTEEKLRFEAMRRLAENDALTGLASRVVYESRFLNGPRAAPIITPLGALVLFDLDGFKRINDRYGHAAGDTCLKVFAERLSASFPEALLTARIGGDEFAMITGSGLQAETLDARVAQFLRHLSDPIVWQGHIFSVHASIGIAVPSDPKAYDPGELFVRADAALYAAKRARRHIS